MLGALDLAYGYNEARHPCTERRNLKTSIGKSILTILFLVTLLDSLVAPRGATPGHGGTFWLAWVLFIRLFLKKPSWQLATFSSLLTVACVASNHRVAPFVLFLQSFYLYFVGGLLILLWERLAHLLRIGGTLENGT